MQNTCICCVNTVVCTPQGLRDWPIVATIICYKVCFYFQCKKIVQISFGNSIYKIFKTDLCVKIPSVNVAYWEITIIMVSFTVLMNILIMSLP